MGQSVGTAGGGRGKGGQVCGVAGKGAGVGTGHLQYWCVSSCTYPSLNTDCQTFGCVHVGSPGTLQSWRPWQRACP